MPSTDSRAEIQRSKVRDPERPRSRLDLGPIKLNANQTLEMSIEWRIKLAQLADDLGIHLRMRTTFARV